MRLAKIIVPSALEVMLGISAVRKVADVDVFRVDGHSNEPAPWRAKINGQYMLTKTGTVRKFRTMVEAIRATEDADASAFVAAREKAEAELDARAAAGEDVTGLYVSANNEIRPRTLAWD